MCGARASLANNAELWEVCLVPTGIKGHEAIGAKQRMRGHHEIHQYPSGRSALGAASSPCISVETCPRSPSTTNSTRSPAERPRRLRTSCGTVTWPFELMELEYLIFTWKTLSRDKQIYP
jgi:hypothetical protein